MRADWNCAGGDTVFVSRGDSLKNVPASHRELITKAVESTFRDPQEHFRAVAARCPFPSMKRYLEHLVEFDRWELRLHTNGFESPGIAAFAFGSRSVLPAEIAPAESHSKTEMPEEISQFYALVDWVHWTAYGGAGGLERGGKHDPIDQRGLRVAKSKIRASKLMNWGSTPCGDAYVYTAEGHAGMVSHENGRLHLLGTASEAVDWIFSKLCVQEFPDFNYSWLKAK